MAQIDAEREIWEAEQAAIHDAARAERDRGGVPEREAPATDPQVSYLEGLRDGKDTSTLSPDQRAWLADADFKKITKRRASDVITILKSLPWAPRDVDSEIAKTHPLPEVRDGRYAIPKTAEQIAGTEAHSPGADAPLMFYSVKKGTHTTFVDVWASDARYPIKAYTMKLAILLAISKDPDAGPRFGREIGKCYVCGRTLTDETSRSLGIGPVCRGDG